MKSLKLRELDLHWRVVDGEVVALEGRASAYLATNPAGTLLWERLAAGTTRDELVSVLADAYELDPELAARDIESFLDSLRDAGLLVEAC